MMKMVMDGVGGQGLGKQKSFYDFVQIINQSNNDIVLHNSSLG